MSAAYRCKLGDYQTSTALEKMGSLITASAQAGFATHYTKQTDAWQAELRLLENFSTETIRRLPAAGEWWLLFEFDIPRRGKRPDIILLADDLIFVLEFKIGASQFTKDDRWQVLSYALDIRDFHLASRERRIIPMLVCTGATVSEKPTPTPDRLVLPVYCMGDSEGAATADAICALYEGWHDSHASGIDAIAWEDSPYRPSPTIIESAEQLFSGHTVANISHAFSKNLDATCRELISAIERAQANRERVICFVTGIPGAGKTLAGLNTVHDPSVRSGGRPAGVFLSGNGPLVKIVRAALIRDQQRAGVSRKEAARTVSTFIDNVHRFITTYGIKRTHEPPYENAIVFDEAQRAWNSEAVEDAHKIQKSEPALVLEIMERAPDWCVIIALVGGGQEINKGEAGLEEWGRALNDLSSSWSVYASPSVLSGDEVVSGHRLFTDSINSHLTVMPSAALHLDVSVRSPRARRISEWVNALLVQRSPPATLDPVESAEFPIVLTRNLETARDWLRTRSEGVQRFGLLASSGALRLRADGLELSSGFRRGFPYQDWFLADSTDSRSSMALEVAASEFECQGLELEWSGVCWGGDFLIEPKGRKWICRKFRGTKWQRVRDEVAVQQVRNKYRVLLTRARRGTVIWIPTGDERDATRDPELFDATAEYLESLGLPSLD